MWLGHWGLSGWLPAVLTTPKVYKVYIVLFLFLFVLGSNLLGLFFVLGTKPFSRSSSTRFANKGRFQFFHWTGRTLSSERSTNGLSLAGWGSRMVGRRTRLVLEGARPPFVRGLEGREWTKPWFGPQRTDQGTGLFVPSLQPDIRHLAIPLRDDHKGATMTISVAGNDSS